MTADKLAELIAAHTKETTHVCIDAEEFINDAADELEADSPSSQYHSWHGHLRQDERCGKCHPFNRAKWVAKARGEK